MANRPIDWAQNAAEPLPLAGVNHSGWALPKSKQQVPEWQAAAEALMMAAEDRGPLMHAHVGMMLALHGAKPIPEFDPSKERHWGRRKLARDI
jgi:hypothetical protein